MLAFDVGAWCACLCQLGSPARCPLTNFFGWEGSPTKIDYRKKGTLILASLLEGLVMPNLGALLPGMAGWCYAGVC